MRHVIRQGYYQSVAVHDTNKLERDALVKTSEASSGNSLDAAEATYGQLQRSILDWMGTPTTMGNLHDLYESLKEA